MYYHFKINYLSYHLSITITVELTKPLKQKLKVKVQLLKDTKKTKAIELVSKVW